jgi:hypothetical protein
VILDFRFEDCSLETPARFSAASEIQNQKSKIKNLSLQKIRPVLLRLFPRSLTAPARDLGMIAMQQNFRRAHPFELRRPRILRTIEHAVRERFIRRRRGAA